jgi:hypothetical protein
VEVGPSTGAGIILIHIIHTHRCIHAYTSGLGLRS